VRQQGEGVELVVMLVSQLIQLTQRNDRRCRHSRASNLEWEISDSSFKPAVPSQPLATARLNGLKEGLGTLSRRD
jgi:hypothetical protein